MTTPPTTMPQPSPAPATATPPQSSRPSRFGLVFGIVAAVLSVGSIVLAIVAPALTSAPKLHVPQGWKQVYNDNPGNTTALWDNARGCTFPAAGLNISSDSKCGFTPANGVELTNGVLIVAQLAPAADVPLSQDAGILLDDTVLVIISQQGDYMICRSTCERFANTDEPVITGSTVAWHADAFVPNELAVLYDSDQQTVSFYVNGQYVNQVSAGLSSTPTVALTTSTSGEALFTHVTIFAASTA